MEKKRVEWIDTLKCLCMIAVLAEHVEFVTPAWNELVEPFFLNLFSFAAGYVYIHREGFGRFFRKKVRQLWVPWLFFSTLTILMAHIFSFNEHKSLAVELGQNMLQIMYLGSEMWYVAALFVAFLPFYFFIRAYEHSVAPLGRKTAALLGISFLLCAGSFFFSRLAPRNLFPWCRPELPVTLPWHLEYMFQAMFFMVLGYLFRLRYEAAFDRHDGVRSCVLLWTAYLLLVIGLPRLIPWTPASELLWYYPRAFLGCAAVISLSKRLRPNAYTRFVGGNTLSYYGLHGKAESFVQAIMRRINAPEYAELVWGDHPEALLYAVAEALLVSVLLIPVAWLIDRYLPFAVGRRRKKEATIRKRL